MSSAVRKWIYIYIYIYIWSSGRTIYHDLLIRHRLYVASTHGPVVEFRLLHTVVVGSISSGGDHGVHCWWDLIRSKQLFSPPYVACRCLLDFLVIVISYIIYQFLHSKLYSYIYVFLIQIIYTQMYGCNYSYLILIIIWVQVIISIWYKSIVCIHLMEIMFSCLI